MKTAIFDFDGTLFDSPRYWIQSMNGYLEERGIPPQADIFEIVKPLGVRKGAALIKERFQISQEVGEIVRLWRSRMGVNYRREIPLREGVRAYLEILKEEGTRICMATAMEKDFVVPALERTGILDSFDFLVTIEDIQADKNSPDIFLYCAEKTQASPGDCTVFEDSPDAARVAHGAGFRVCGVFDGVSQSDYEKIRPYCVRWIRSFTELAEDPEILSGAEPT